ncbi:MAG TPA: hypothetical protein VLA12_19115, partial [Planctomycetaceae bacterium]|nr:hypothetical protein [Planctomycetaceae bacterium]
SPELAEWEQAFQSRNPSRASLAALKERWKDRVNEFRPAEYHFLDLLLSDAPVTLWLQSSLLSEALNATLEAHRVASLLEARSFRGLHEMIAAADVIRRTADDRLFQDDPDLWLEAERNYQTARAEYQKILELAEQRELAYQKCDEVDAALPYLSEWATALPERRRLAGIDPPSLSPLLGELVFHSRSLRTLLDSGDSTAPQTAPEIETLTQVETRIRTAIENEVILLSSVQDLTLENYHAANALLRLPFLSGQTRRSLENTRQTILVDLRRRTKSRIRLPESEKIVPRSWGVLFLTEKLPSELSGLGNLLSKWNDSEQTLDWERKIRSELRHRAAHSSKSEHQNDQLAGEFFADHSAPLRQTAAWIRADSPGQQFALRHQQFLAARVLLHEADRTLKDFWGPTSTRSQVFSLQAAQTLLSSSDHLSGHQFNRDELREIEELQLSNARTLVERG